MKKRILFFGFFIFLSISTTTAWATEESVDQGLSLDQALQTAFVRNPKMIEARKEISASKGRWIQAEALPDPEVGVDIGGLKKQRKDEKEVRDGNLDSVTIKQPLDPLGTRFLRARIGHDGVNIAKGELDIIWGEVRKAVIENYARILAEEKAQEIVQDNLNTTRQFFSKVETRFQSGSALKSDLIRAKIEVSRAENDLLVSQKNLKVSKGELNLALGQGVEDPLVLKDTLAYEALQYEYEKIRRQAVGARADVRNEATRLSSKQKGLWSAVLTTFFPKMAIGLQRTTQDFENDTAILIEASYPLWGFNLGQIKEAKAEKEKQKVHLDALKREVGLEVYRAFLEAELADKQVVLQKQTLEESNELLRQITIRYEAGEIQFLTYLENIKTIKETRLAYFNVLKDYKERVAELERVIQATPVPERVTK